MDNTIQKVNVTVNKVPVVVPAGVQSFASFVAAAKLPKNTKSLTVRPRLTTVGPNGSINPVEGDNITTDELDIPAAQR